VLAELLVRSISIPIFETALDVILALEALRNALYKFKTYLLTYISNVT